MLMEAVSRSRSPSYQCILNPSYDDYFLNQSNPFLELIIFRHPSGLWFRDPRQDLLLFIFNHHEHRLYEDVHSHHMVDILINDRERQ